MPRLRSGPRKGIRVTAIHRALIRIYGFDGGYSSVNRFVRSLVLSKPEATVHLDFSPAAIHERFSVK